MRAGARIKAKRTPWWSISSMDSERVLRRLSMKCPSDWEDELREVQSRHVV
jgi:hypothetical protein